MAICIESCRTDGGPSSPSALRQPIPWRAECRCWFENHRSLGLEPRCLTRSGASIFWERRKACSIAARSRSARSRASRVAASILTAWHAARTIPAIPITAPDQALPVSHETRSEAKTMQVIHNPGTTAPRSGSGSRSEHDTIAARRDRGGSRDTIDRKFWHKRSGVAMPGRYRYDHGAVRIAFVHPIL